MALITWALSALAVVAIGNRVGSEPLMCLGLVMVMLTCCIC